MKALIFSVALMFGLSAQADLKSTFSKLNNTYKGPFSLNYLQSTGGRVSIREGGTAPGTFQFQAAFRNEMAQELATQYDFYLGNLFTTNYYELTGKFVYGDQYGSHELNEQALLAAAPQAVGMASAMVRNWVLEKHYVTFFPNTQIGKGFNLRGISGAEFEQPYAYYFFNFYLSAINDDYQFLPAFLLAKSSPISDSSSLDRARTMIALAYDSAKTTLGEEDAGVKAFYQLRNAVHNQMSPDLVKRIDTFLASYPNVAGFYANDLRQIQEIIRNYYNAGPKRIIELAAKAGAQDIKAAAEAISQNGLNAERVVVLAKLAADLRTALTNNSLVRYQQKTPNLILLTSVSQYLNKEIGNLERISSKEVIKAVFYLLYVEGFLIKDNLDYFTSEVDMAAGAVAAIAIVPDVVEISNDTLIQAFSPSFDQWLSLEPKMQYFIDNTIKSSALNTAALIAKKVK